MKTGNSWVLIYKRHVAYFQCKTICLWYSNIWQRIELSHAIPISDIVTNVEPLCSAYKMTSNGANLMLPAWFLNNLTYLSMYFILELVSTDFNEVILMNKYPAQISEHGLNWCEVYGAWQSWWHFVSWEKLYDLRQYLRYRWNDTVHVHHCSMCQIVIWYTKMIYRIFNIYWHNT